MEAAQRWFPCVCFLIALLLPSIAAGPVGSSGGDAVVLDGRIRMEGLTVKPADIKLVLDSGKDVTFCHADGYFAFLEVAPGSHLLEVVAIGYYFPPLRVDVSARRHGEILVSWAENRRKQVPTPLVLAPLLPLSYYEKRQPPSLMGLLKNPMALMVLFSAGCIFLLPKMADSMDPEELKEMQQKMANQPSLKDLLQGKVTKD